MKAFQVYPTELERAEAAAIRERRAVVDAPAMEPGGPRTAEGPARPAGDGLERLQSESGVAPPASDGGRLPDDTVGLALSGGGIRSSTYCLGVLQSLARRGLLKHVDILSTVSGGGYVGSFLGRFYDRLRASPTTAPEVVESALRNSASQPMRWLRKHGEFIAPAGKSDLQADFAIFLRNFLTLQFVLGLLAFAWYGLVNLVRYGIGDPIVSLLPYFATVHWTTSMPLGRLLGAADLGVLWSPWFALFELCVALRVVPLALGYWLASQDEDESYSPPALLFAFVALLALLAAAVRQGVDAAPLLGALAILVALCDVERAWARVGRDTAAVGSGGPRVKQLRARTWLTLKMGAWITLSGVLLYFAAIDTLGHALYEGWGRGTPAFLRTLAWLGGVLVAALPVLRGVVQLMAESKDKPSPIGTWWRLIHRPTWSAIAFVVLLSLPLLIVSYLSHGAYGGGSAVGRGLAVSAVALVLSLVLATPRATALVNRSSLQSTYAARLARAFMGASNPLRAGEGVDDVLPGDDVDNLAHYRPHAAGGPLHLINLCVNQTVDEDTLRAAHERLGTAMACSGLGVSVGKFYHALWNPAYQPVAAEHMHPARAKPGAAELPLKVVGHVPGVIHPLLGADGQPPDQVEQLPLRDWVAISGAAFGPGRGSETSAAEALLFTLANVRIGYWWNSGLGAGDRGSRPDLPFLGRIAWMLPRLFETQTRLLAEALARFRGPWDQLWYLSDGGHFEAMGGYELLRRRVPYVILLDGTGGYGDFARFERLVRIDFGAELTTVTRAEWAAVVQDDVRDVLRPADRPARQAFWDALARHVHVDDPAGGAGPLATIATSVAAAPRVDKHAALLKASFPRGRATYILYVVASLSGDEPPDVLEYGQKYPDFPNQGIVDQFFDEGQWESHRRLGEHIGDGVLGPAPPRHQLSIVRREALWLTKFGR